MAFGRYRLGLQGFPLRGPHHPCGCGFRGVPHDLHFTFRAPDGCGRAAESLPTFGFFASLGIRSSCVSSVPLVRSVTLSRDPTTLTSRGICASTPDSVSTVIVALAAKPVRLFRPRGFSPPRRFPPHRGSGLVASRYRKGFASFPRRVHRLLRCVGPKTVIRLHPAIRAVSRCAPHTPRRSPPVSSRVASLRPLPPRRCAFVTC